MSIRETLTEALEDAKRDSVGDEHNQIFGLCSAIRSALAQLEQEGTRIEGWVDTIAFARDPVIRFLRDDPKDTQTAPAILILTDSREKKP